MTLTIKQLFAGMVIASALDTLFIVVLVNDGGVVSFIGTIAATLAFLLLAWQTKQVMT